MNGATKDSLRDLREGPERPEKRANSETEQNSNWQRGSASSARLDDAAIEPDGERIPAYGEGAGSFFQDAWGVVRGEVRIAEGKGRILQLKSARRSVRNGDSALRRTAWRF